jgi:hypothetical protein
LLVSIDDDIFGLKFIRIKLQILFFWIEVQ